MNRKHHLTILSASLLTGSMLLAPACSEGNPFIVTDANSDYWLHNKAIKGVCGARLKPNLEVLVAAAQNGNEFAAFRLGQLYDSGTWGVKKDSGLAIQWYTEAASNGHYHSQLKLAVSYELGKLVEKDSRKSLFWYQTAYKQT